MTIDAAALNAAAKTGPSTTTNLSTRMTKSASSLADSEKTFMSLMTTQLKNQDPLSPVDSTQFTQQIVQMTGVEQQLLTNDLLKALVGMNNSGLNSSVNLIGKDVTTQASTGELKNGKVSFDFTLPSTAATLKLDVVNASGVTVATLDGTDLTGKGDHSVTWNGKTAGGVQTPDGGLYSLKISAQSAGGAAIHSTATSSSTGRVTAVSQENGVTIVTVGNRKIPTSQIVSVAEAAAATPAPTPAANTNTSSTQISGSAA
jgi:flagellar basal-body rod modification protein FlgD